MNEVKVSDKYQQQYAHFGRMNDVLYKLPPLFATIIGGLWFFAAGYLEKDKVIASIVFILAQFALAVVAATISTKFEGNCDAC